MLNKINFKDVILSEDTAYSTKNLVINKKRLTTPVKAVDVSKTDKEISENKKIRSLNEIYRKIPWDKDKQESKLKKIVLDDSIFNYKLNTLLNKTNANDEVNICFVEYETPIPKYPTGKNLNFIVDTCYEYSDITCLPIISNLRNFLSDEKEFKNYLIFLKESLERIKSLNNKPLMGVIPLTKFFISDLVEFYVKNDVDAFAIDFDGRTPCTVRQTLRDFRISLKGHDILNKSYTHAININEGRFIKKSSVVCSKDILSFGFGIDSIGERHKPLRAPKEFFEKLNREENKIRLFNKQDYGCYKIERKKIEETFVNETDSEIRKELFTNDKFDFKKIQKLFNTEQKGLEAINLRQIISEEKMEKYLSRKKYVNKEDIKIIRKMNSLREQKSLKNFKKS